MVVEFHMCASKGVAEDLCKLAFYHMRFEILLLDSYMTPPPRPHLESFSESESSVLLIRTGNKPLIKINSLVAASVSQNRKLLSTLSPYLQESQSPCAGNAESLKRRIMTIITGKRGRWNSRA